MSQPSKSALKKQLLRSAVADNLATREGQPPQPRNRPAAQRPKRWLWWSAPLVILVLAGFLLKSADDVTASGVTARGLELSAAAASSQAAADQQTEAAQAALAALAARPERRFDAPQHIDPHVFPLSVQRIVIDPGHGGDDRGTADENLTEKDLTLDIAQKVKAKLEDSFEVRMTREDDETISLKDRALLANELHADLFVSIHINWIADRGVRGVETYFLGATDDPELNELARRENRQSGYSLADMKSLLEGIYTGVRQDESRRFAHQIQRSLYSSLVRDYPGLKNRGVKTAPFVVLVATEMPAILAEVSCLSNRQEAEFLSRPLYREHIAEALSRGIRRYADEVNQTEEKGT